MIDPVLISIGNIEIRYYGLVFVLGILLVWYFLKKYNVDKRDEVLFYLLIGMFLGARFFGLLSNGINPISLEFFRVWNGGMAFFGGLLGALISGYYVIKKEGLNLLKIADIVVVPVSFTLILGRLANYTNGELLGKLSDVSWCIDLMGCRHPYTLYAAFLQLILFVIVLVIFLKVKRKGVTFYSFLIGYGFVRLIGDLFKEDVRLLGLTYWQYAAILLIIVGIYYLLKRKSVE